MDTQPAPPSNTPSDSNSRLSKSDTQNIQRILKEIEEYSAYGDYIFRGEARFHDEIATGIRRAYKHLIEANHVSPDDIQVSLLAEAHSYTTQTDSVRLLSEVQHFGGITNLLDFTEDYRIALFFACEAHFLEEGRVIICQRATYPTVVPTVPLNRTIAQKSVFVSPPHGVVDADYSVTIPTETKIPMLEHLKALHGISGTAIYNDLHGFIKRQRNRREAEKAFLKAVDISQTASSAEALADQIKIAEDALKLLKGAASVDLYRHGYFALRGMYESMKGNYAEAVEWLDKAIGSGLDMPQLRYARGGALFFLERTSEAKADLHIALDWANQAEMDDVRDQVVDMLNDCV